MVIGLAMDLTIKAGCWIVSQTYNGLHYLYYGHQQTPEERIALQLQALEEENKVISEKLDKLSKSTQVREQVQTDEFLEVNRGCIIRRPRAHSN